MFKGWFQRPANQAGQVALVGFIDLRNKRRVIAPFAVIRQVSTVSAEQVTRFIRETKERLDSSPGILGVIQQYVAGQDEGGEAHKALLEMQESQKTAAADWAHKAKRLVGAEYMIDVGGESLLVIGLEYFESIPQALEWVKQ